MNQRGSTSYLLLASVITVGLLGTALAFTWNRLNACHEVRAALQQQVVSLEGKLEEQNARIGEWEKEAKARQEASRKAVEGARRRSEGIDKELARLKALQGKVPVSPCPAGDAVKDLRRGLG